MISRHHTIKVFQTVLLAVLIIGIAACDRGRMPPGPGSTEPRIAAQEVIQADGVALPLRRWPARTTPKAVILAVHGFNDYSKAFEMPALWWAERGITTYAFDQRGFGEAPHHGLWAGRDRLVDDVAVLSRLLRRRHGETPLYLLGESMGGAVVLTAMTGETPPPVDGAILSAPAVRAGEDVPFYEAWALWLAGRLIPTVAFSGEDMLSKATDNQAVLEDIFADPLFIKDTQVSAAAGLVDLMISAHAQGAALSTNSLLLYGENDHLVDPDSTFKLWSRLAKRDLSASRFALYDQGWHLLLRDRQAQTVWQDVVAWIEDPHRPLPSGADEWARKR